MAQIEILACWRKQVCAVLATEATGKLIRWTRDAEDRFQASFLEAWPYEVYAAFRTYLEGQNPTGCEKNMESPPGETYEFFFQFKGKKTYGKILLRNDGKQIVIFSAHTPLMPKLSCE